MNIQEILETLIEAGYCPSCKKYIVAGFETSTQYAATCSGDFPYIYGDTIEEALTKLYAFVKERASKQLESLK